MENAITITERPILFSAPMVRALLAGTKTQTRRVMKRLPPAPNHGIIPHAIDFCHYGTGWNWKDEHGNCSCKGVMCPYGHIGDRLWVRETWASVPTTAYAQSDGVQQKINPADRWMAAIYKAGWERSAPTWKPSIHMPRWATRILLEITDVRVQRLQDISEEDAFAEGLERMDPGKTGWNTATILLDGWHQNDRTAVALYQRLWESINGTGSWDRNEWVWALTFKRVQP